MFAQMRLHPSIAHRSQVLGSNCLPKPCQSARRRVNKPAATLREQQQELIHKVSKLLSQQTAQHDAAALVAADVSQLVRRGVSVCQASAGWQQLLEAFRRAEDSYNRKATIANISNQGADGTIGRTTSSWGFAIKQPRQHQQQASDSTQSTPTPAAEPQENAAVSDSALQPAGSQPAKDASFARNSSSPWGFALRQPSSQLSAQASQQIVDADPALVATPAQQACQPSSMQLWHWSAVQQFTVLGLGSLGQYAGATQEPKASSRLGFRFLQLVLATTLATHLLPGLTSKPAAYDPDFDGFDQLLLTSLGFEVVEVEPSHTVTCRTLMYMPCCPRQLYSQVLSANWSSEHMQQLAIFGTSMRSLSDTQGLFECLTAPDQSQGSSASRSGSTNGETSCVQRAYKEGRVIEVPAPDCAAHGVGVAVHLFQ